MGQPEHRSDRTDKVNPSPDDIANRVASIQKARIEHGIGPSGAPVIRFPKPEVSLPADSITSPSK